MADTMYALSFFNLWQHPPTPSLQREVEGGKNLHLHGNSSQVILSLSHYADS